MVDWFLKGGPVMWPLLICSIAMVALVVERAFFWIQHHRHHRSDELEEWLGYLRGGRLWEGIRMGQKSDHPIVQTLSGALRCGEPFWPDALALAIDEADRKVRAHLAWLDTIITLAPLLGIFGTVSGIIKAFDLLGRASPTPQAVSVGIAEALITTEFGLAIAMPALVFYNLFHSLSNRYVFRLERYAHELEMVLKEAKTASSSIGPTTDPTVCERGGLPVA